MSVELKIELAIEDDKDDDIVVISEKPKDKSKNDVEIVGNIKREDIKFEPSVGSGRIDTKSSIKSEFFREQPKRDIYPISQVSGYDVDYSEFAQMEAMGLPTGFIEFHMEPTHHQKLGRYGRAYYCELCDVRLRSEDTKENHQRGIRHMKKQLAFQQRTESNISARSKGFDSYAKGHFRNILKTEFKPETQVLDKSREKWRSKRPREYVEVDAESFIDNEDAEYVELEKKPKVEVDADEVILL